MYKKTMIKLKKFKLILVILIGLNYLSCTKEAVNQNHKLENRKFQGIPSMAISHEGRLWAVWYAGKTPAEDENNYVVVSTSGDGGKSWTEKFYIDPDGEGPFRAFDSQLWMDSEGTLWLFWAETIGHDGTNAGLWVKTNDNPDKENSKWSEPRQIADGIMMCKPTVLSNGEWVFPISTWRDTDNSAKVVVSNDKGKTFSIRGGCNVPKEVRDYDEHMIVERKDKSLWMLIRTKYGIGESVSTDRGETWSALVSSSIQHPSARFFIRRLSSGNLLLVKHGQINERIGRSHLTAFLSEDDGYTWKGGLLLDERSGVSYPDGQQYTNGVIHIIYDYSRTSAREILIAKFTEDDVIKGDTASSSVSLQMIVSKYSDSVNFKKLFLNDVRVEIKPQQKGNEIRYTNDGTEPNQNSLLYKEPFIVTKTTKLKIREYTTDGIKRPVYEANYIKQQAIKSVAEILNYNGLAYDFFELPEPIDSLSELQKYKPTKKGEIEKLVFPCKMEELPEYFGLILNGYINVPKEDVYTFSVLSNDGSRLYVADELVVDNDKQHGAYEKKGEIVLQKGWHKIKLSYFQAGGGKNLKVYWQGTEIQKKEIPGSVLSHE